MHHKNKDNKNNEPENIYKMYPLCVVVSYTAQRGIEDPGLLRHHGDTGVHAIRTSGQRHVVGDRGHERAGRVCHSLVIAAMSELYGIR